MGADGGSIAKRSELVTVTDDANNQAALLRGDKYSEWTRCALSGELLEDPVVSDWDGFIYNKVAVLAYLLGELVGKTPRTKLTQIRDVVELSRQFENGRWIDPITRKDLAREGHTENFAYIPQCGHISAYQMLRRLGNCPVCEKGYNDLVILNPKTRESEARNRSRIDKLESLGLSHSLRPIKRKNRKRNREDSSTSGFKQSKVLPE